MSSDDSEGGDSVRDGGPEQRSERVQFRPRRVLWMTIPSTVVVLAAFVIVGVLLRSADTGARFFLSDQIAIMAVGVLIAGFIMLWAAPRVRADELGIEVRNVLTKRYFAWGQVLSVSFPDGASWARLELPEDEYHAVMAIQAVDRRRAVEAVRALRRLHKRAWVE